MKKIFISGGTLFQSMIYMKNFPQPKPQTAFSKKFAETIGGTGTGKALNLNKLDFDLTLHALVGNDTYGDKILSTFKEQNLNFIYDIDPKGTERHINIMNDIGERISIYVNYATFEPEIDLSKFEPIIANTDYLVLNIINYCRNLIPFAKKHQKEIWCDIHDYDGKNQYHIDFIESASYIFMSSDNLPDYKGFMEKLIQDGKKLVVCTHGKDGSTALTNTGKWIETPIIEEYNNRKVDTNGAGDSFFAGVLYGHSKGYDIEKCLKMGTIVSGLCVTSQDFVSKDLSPEYIENEYKKYY